MDEVRAHMAATIKRLRKQSGMNVDELGEILDRSGKTISAWETGRGQPDADKLIEICRLFSVSISEFFGPAESITENMLTAEESELVQCFRAMTPSRRDSLMTAARDGAAMSKEAAERGLLSDSA